MFGCINTYTFVKIKINLLRCEGDEIEKEINVVGAIIYSDNKILCAQRSENMSLPLKWEFPGGKIENGETEKMH